MIKLDIKNLINLIENDPLIVVANRGDHYVIMKSLTLNFIYPVEFKIRVYGINRFFAITRDDIKEDKLDKGLSFFERYKLYKAVLDKWIRDAEYEKTKYSIEIINKINSIRI